MKVKVSIMQLNNEETWGSKRGTDFVKKRNFDIKVLRKKLQFHEIYIYIHTTKLWTEIMN